MPPFSNPATNLVLLLKTQLIKGGSGVRARVLGCVLGRLLVLEVGVLRTGSLPGPGRGVTPGRAVPVSGGWLPRSGRGQSLGLGVMALKAHFGRRVLRAA